MNNITILFVSLKCKQKNKTLCYSTAKLLIFFIWQTTSAIFLMKQLKNIKSNDGKKKHRNKPSRSTDAYLCQKGYILIIYKQSCKDA